MYVKFVAKELGLDGSYIPRTYIEQIQLEKLINDVMVSNEIHQILGYNFFILVYHISHPQFHRHCLMI